MLKKLKGHDILVVPAVGIMLLTERLQDNDGLWVDCAGDEYSPGADGGFESPPISTSSTAGSGSPRAGSGVPATSAAPRFVSK
jgi:hypothetical protein